MNKFYHETSDKKNGLVVFDFDRSLFTIDDIDNVIAKKFLGYSGEDLLKLVKERSIGWNAMMDSLASEIYDKGYKQDDIVNALEDLELEEHIIKSLDILMKNNYEQKILSDANSIFIKHVLNGRKKGLHYFNEVVTNPAYFDETGRLRIGPFHLKSHGCERCPINMCKGKVTQDWVASNTYDRIIYVGDGSGDYCATVALRENDVVLVRKDYDLHRMIEKEPIRAKVILWENAIEMYQHIERLMEMDKENKLEDILLKTNNSTINNGPSIELKDEPKIHGSILEKTECTPYVEEVFGTSTSVQNEIPSVEEVADESSSFVQFENERIIIPQIEEIFDEPQYEQFKKKEILFENPV